MGWALGVEKTTVEPVEFDEDRALLVAPCRRPRGAAPLWAVPAAVSGL